MQLGINHAKVSKQLAGQIVGFSIERLIDFPSLLSRDSAGLCGRGEARSWNGLLANPSGLSFTQASKGVQSKHSIRPEV